MSKDLPIFKKEEIVLNLVFKDPRKGSHSLSALLPQIDNKPLLSNRGVYLILQKFDLTTAKKRRAFIRLQRRLGRQNGLDVVANWPGRQEKLTSEERLTMISRVQEGEPVKAVCQAYDVSRKTFYKWQERYSQAAKTEQKLALADKVRRVERYWRQASAEDEQKVLNIVLSHPELSAHKIVQFLPQAAGKPIIGNHGVQNILRRYHLTTFEARLAYQKTREAIRPVTLPNLANAFYAPLRALRMALSPFATVPKSTWFKSFVAVSFFSLILFIFARFWLTMFTHAPAQNKPGLIFATVSLICGSIFFLYSLKYYLTLALVLGFSRHVGEPENGHDNNSQSFWLERFLGRVNGRGNGQGTYKGGLQPNLNGIKLTRFPFVSIHLPLYNEKKVVDRLLTACTSLDYPNFEVIVVDDSTDATTQILKDWQDHPRVKVIHRASREGFKGGALRLALSVCDPRTEFVLVFDADFVPYPDTITQFLKYFQSITGTLDFSRLGSSQIAAIQGYQWHVLNKSENWITRGVRSEYAGSYLVERSGAEVLGALKQIAGSVYMVRKDILDKFGWQTSITEDFQLTLRLYEQGYKVVYTPYIQAPSECVSTITRLIRQRMRWAEGHSYNIKEHFWRLLTSGKVTGMEKAEFLYLSPYYLQAFFFMVGTLAWIISETVLRARLPFWTALWGWSLVLTNMFALPLMNTVGLFLEESEEKDYLGIFSFVGLSYLLVPFQAYASLKGFLEKEEGPWFRTPKTGKITDIFTRGRFYRWISGIIPGTRPAYNGASAVKPALSQVNPYLALATANNQFSNFRFTPKRKTIRWIGKVALVILLIFALTVNYFAISVPSTFAFGSDRTFSVSDATLNATRTGTAAGTSGNATLTVASTTGFAVGDWVLIIQMTGTGKGDFEEAVIQSIDLPTQVTLTANKNNTYTNDVSSKAQMIKAEINNNVTVNSGVTISTPGWDGTTGGVLYYLANTFTVNSTGVVEVDGDGFTGGGGGSLGAGDTNVSGTGVAGGAGSSGSGDGGGGGGSVTTAAGGGNSSANNVQDGGGGGGSGGGGAGGSYGSAASNGSAGVAGGNSGGGETGVKAGGAAGSAGAAIATYGCADFTDATGCVFLGSGGGGGGGGAGGGDGDDNNGGNGSGGAAGGAGGGIIYIHTNSLTNNGIIRANGVVGSDSSAASNGVGGGVGGGGGGGGRGGSGGGGSGGSIWLAINTNSIGGTGSITTSGGSAGTAGAGGGGGACSSPDPDGGGGGGGGSAASSGGSTNCTTAGASVAGSGTVGSAGGDGRIKCDDSDGGSCTFSGFFSPSPGNTEVANAPVPEYAILGAPLIWFIPKLIEKMRRKMNKNRQLDYEYAVN